MFRRGILLSTLVLSIGLLAQNAGSVTVTYLANEGFMIAGPGQKVIIDGLFAS